MGVLTSARANQHAIELLAGLLAGPLLVTHGDWWRVGLAGLLGLAQPLIFRPGDERVTLENTVATAALGVPLWSVLDVVLLPLAQGRAPQWTVDGMQALFPNLVAWVLFGGVLGVLVQVFTQLARQRFGIEADQAPLPPPPTVRRVVIVGGGFAGVSTAQHLEHAIGPDRSISLTLVSDTNALLFTPMLAEVAGSSLEPTHISSPLRSALRRTDVIRGRVEHVDLDQHVVLVGAEAGKSVRTLPFDHLVLALGSVSNFLGLTGVRDTALDFKSLADAMVIRNQVIDAFERASDSPDAAQRQALLTFVVAGGGFAGVELAGALNDFTRGMLVDYPNLASDEIRIVLVHPRPRILPELSQGLAEYALNRMVERGVTFKLNSRIKDARPGVVLLQSEEEVPAHTLIWTAGVTPNPLLRTLPESVARDGRGALIVESTLAVSGKPGLWALGDCAAVSDGRTGQACPPTAQFAIRQAATLAANIHAALDGRQLKPFHFDALGTLCVIGHHTACAEIRGLRFSGLFAWLLWRAIYLEKLPGLDRKVRVLTDWVIELFFPRDIVQTIDLSMSRRVAGAAQLPPDQSV